MKLVEILAREYVWDVLENNTLEQCFDGRVIVSTGGLYIVGSFNLAEDWVDCKVTYSQWQAEREKIAMNQQATREAREIARTGLTTSGYEQELWDRVAVAFIGGYAADTRSHWTEKGINEIVSQSAAVADAFMQERAKRLKK